LSSQRVASHSWQTLRELLHRPKIIVVGQSPTGRRKQAVQNLGLRKNGRPTESLVVAWLKAWLGLSELSLLTEYSFCKEKG
jgi:hypothetical protein